MPPIVISALIIIVLAILFFVLSVWTRGHIYSRLEREVSSGELDAFYKRVDSHLTRALLAPYGRELLRFRAIASHGDHAAMAEQFNRLMRLKLTDYERSCVLTEGFNGFAAAGDAKHCRRIVEEMEKGGFADKALAAYRRHLDVALLGKQVGVAGLKAAYPQLRGARRAYAAYLLARSCESARDEVAARGYRKEAVALYGCAEADLAARAHVNTTV